MAVDPGRRPAPPQAARPRRPDACGVLDRHARSTTRRPTCSEPCSGRSPSRPSPTGSSAWSTTARRLPHVAEVLDAAAAADPRITLVRRRAQRRHRRRRRTTRCRVATGEFVALLDHDDELHPDALRRVAERHRGPARGRLRSTPTRTRSTSAVAARRRSSSPTGRPSGCARRCTPATSACCAARWSPRSAASTASSRARRTGTWCCGSPSAPAPVVHVPEVLYHWRTLADLTAGGGEEAKPYAYEAGTRAVQAHCDRIGFPATVERSHEHSGVYHLRPALRHHPLGEHRHPHRRRGPRRAGRARHAGVPLRAQHRRGVDLSRLRDRRRRRRHDAARRARRACGTSPATG